ncbi:hypothetical protein F2Q68_00026146 [Brassica cretica]|uniref:Uncharacterized protein n=2 Tax=Brassica cretica TaxID=69181 RepID=A0A8S9IH76_BRACR|nr:hypothetical protein F2Q68_00026146 [Brassica cretica]KAF3578824.1 hypothetical protein DY000_02032288 [Brassica cretica]
MIYLVVVVGERSSGRDAWAVLTVTVFDGAAFDGDGAAFDSNGVVLVGWRSTVTVRRLTVMVRF